MKKSIFILIMIFIFVILLFINFKIVNFKNNLDNKELSFNVMELKEGPPATREEIVEGLYYRLKAKGIYVSKQEVFDYYDSGKEDIFKDLKTSNKDISLKNRSLEEEIILLSRESDRHIYSSKDFNKGFIKSLLNVFYPYAYSENIDELYYDNIKNGEETLWCLNKVDENNMQVCLIKGYRIENEEILYDSLEPILNFNYNKDMNYLKINY